MRLSEAIRLGAMALPEAHGPIIEWGAGNKPCGACLLGSVLFALRGDTLTFKEYHSSNGFGVEGVEALIASRWPWVTTPVHKHPQCDFTDETELPMRMMLLYEFNGWTRERIADWVETLEAAQADPAVVTQGADRHEPTTRDTSSPSLVEV